MAAPTLSQDEKDALTAAQTVAAAGEAGAIQAILGWEQAIEQQEKIDASFAKFFTYYNTDIIRNYEIERRYLDGQDIANPIVEQDILDFANETGRLYDVDSVSGGDYSPTRIDEFDGSPLAPTDDEHETFLIPEQDIITGWLVTYPSQNITFPASATTLTELNASSNSLEYDSDGTETVNVGDTIFISDGTNSTIVEVTSVGGTCSDPQYTDQATCETNGETWTNALGIEVLIPPANPIPSGSPLGQKSYEGFTDSERTNKTATDSDFQPIMDYLLDELNSFFNRRLAVLNAEKLALQANLDDNLDPSALSNVDASITSLEGFQGATPPSTIDISDTGLTDIENESSSRLTQVNTRISDIPTAITSGNYYDLRYQYADSRARLDNGSLRLLQDYQDAKEGQQEAAGSAGSLEQRYGDLLNT